MAATDLGFGVNWTFERNRIGDYQVGYFAKPDYPLSTAAGVSSCFPPIFAAYRSPFPQSSVAGREAGEADRKHVLRDLRLNDGGNYDNLGLEPIWKNHQTVLVSDGGAVFEYAPDSGMLGRLLRYS